MRPREESPLDPEVVATLDAIDAVLSGRAIDPRQDDTAELALLLRDERPRMDAAFAAQLDQRVQRRFVPVPSNGMRRQPRRRRWIWAPAAGLAAALVVAVVVVVGQGGGVGAVRNAPIAAKSAAPHFHATSGQVKAAVSSASPAQAVNGTLARRQTTAAVPLAPAIQPFSQTVAPFPNGRRIIQSAQLSLTTPARLVDQVAQEVFNAVGQAHGIVQRSTVTANGGPGGYAQFQLSIPSAALPQTMATLSTLPHARVASRTDSTQDVNDSYQADQRHLADARALRASLLKQLAAAVTQGEIDSLTARLHGTEAAISSDEATLRSLQHQIAYSQVMVTINAGAVPVLRPNTGSGGFTLGGAAHDAGRVLTVAAGIVLIGLAALLPVGLLLALLWWIAGRIRHRRRLQALDLI